MISLRHYSNRKFLLIWKVSIRLGSYVVDLFDPNGMEETSEWEVVFLKNGIGTSI